MHRACLYSVKQSEHSGKHAGLAPLLPNRIDVTYGRTVWRFQPHSTDRLPIIKLLCQWLQPRLGSGKARNRSTVCLGKADEVLN